MDYLSVFGTVSSVRNDAPSHQLLHEIRSMAHHWIPGQYCALLDILHQQLRLFSTTSGTSDHVVFCRFAPRTSDRRAALVASIRQTLIRCSSIWRFSVAQRFGPTVPERILCKPQPSGNVSTRHDRATSVACSAALHYKELADIS